MLFESMRPTSLASQRMFCNSPNSSEVGVILRIGLAKVATRGRAAKKKPVLRVERLLEENTPVLHAAP